MKNSLARTVHQHRAFLELGKVVAATEGGLWTGILPTVLGPASASWGVAYRLIGQTLELVASEGIPMSLRSELASFDLTRHSAFAGCRAIRTRRPVSDDQVFGGLLEERVVAQLEALGVAVGSAIPVLHGGTLLGVLLAGNASREPLDGESLLFLDAISNLVAPALALVEIARGSPADERRSSRPPRRVSASIPARKKVDLGRVAQDAVQQIGAALRRLTVDIQLRLDEECVGLGDANELRLAIAHLVTNAAEAAAERTNVGFSPLPRKVDVSVLREGDVIVVAVSDSGRGVPAEMRSRIFDSGFSTKAKGRGNGLSQVQKIAIDHAGRVEVGSSTMGGATFRMLLPSAFAKTDAAHLSQGATVPQMRAVGQRQGGKRSEPSAEDPEPDTLRKRRFAS